MVQASLTSWLMRWGESPSARATSRWVMPPARRLTIAPRRFAPAAARASRAPSSSLGCLGEQRRGARGKLGGHGDTLVDALTALERDGYVLAARDASARERGAHDLDAAARAVAGGPRPAGARSNSHLAIC